LRRPELPDSVTATNSEAAAELLVAGTAGQANAIAWSIDVEGMKAQPYRDTTGPRADGWRLLHDNGLRRGEVVPLDVADLDLERARVAVVGKGQTERAPGPLFVNFDPARKGSGRLTADGLHEVVRALGRWAGLGRAGGGPAGPGPLRVGPATWPAVISKRPLGAFVPDNRHWRELTPTVATVARSAPAKAGGDDRAGGRSGGRRRRVSRLLLQERERK
jgi:integrase